MALWANIIGVAIATGILRWAERFVGMKWPNSSIGKFFYPPPPFATSLGTNWLQILPASKANWMQMPPASKVSWLELRLASKTNWLKMPQLALDATILGNIRSHLAGDVIHDEHR
jgi:hypothetical protein